MLAPLVALKNLVKSKTYHIDYPLFRLHYRVTAGLILAYCAILGAKILFGDVIDCAGRGEDKSKADFYDNTCYAQGTYTYFYFSALNENGTLPIRKECLHQYRDNHDVVNFLNLNMIWSRIRDVALMHNCFIHEARYFLPGIPVATVETDQVIKKHVYHGFYQYLPVLLFLQAVFFYLPHYLWKMWENGVISSICKQLYDHRFEPKKFVESSDDMINYIKNYLCRNGSLVYKYYFCQILLLVNLIGQIITLNHIFNGNFFSYGSDTLYYFFVDNKIYGFEGPKNLVNHIELNNPMDIVFPKFTACTVQHQTMDGDLSHLQFICVLTLNVFNDKFYLVLWFWFVLLTVITTVQVIFDMLYLVLPVLQRFLFDRKFGDYQMGSKRGTSPLPEVFLLDLIGSNSDRYAFITLLKRMAKEESNNDPEALHSLV